MGRASYMVGTMKERTGSLRPLEALPRALDSLYVLHERAECLHGEWLQ